MLMYIGGMQMTPARDVGAVADRRSAGHDADAVCRRRTAAAAACPCRRTASGRGRRTTSTRPPKRNPSRMPCLTQRVDAPAGRRRRDRARRHARVPSDSAGAQVGERRPRLLLAGASGLSRRPERLDVARARLDARRRRRPRAAARGRRARARCGGATPRTATPSAAGTLRSSRPIRAIAALTGIGIRLDEVDLHQRQTALVQRAGGGPVVALDTLRPCRAMLAGHLVAGHRDDALAADRHHRQRDARRRRESTRKSRRQRPADVADLGDVPRRFLDADDVRDLAPAAPASRLDVQPVRPATL